MMHLIPTWLYGIKDYVFVALMLSAPWLFGFAEGGAETWVIVAVGIVGLLHTVITRFPLGLGLIAMNKHIAMDFGAGLFLIAAPFMFGFYDSVWIPYVALGVAELVVASLAQRGPREVTDATAVEVIGAHRVK
jgi:hypothetical protein